MSKHILDRARSRESRRLPAFEGVRRRLGADGSHPASVALARRSKGPHNPALRYMAFLRIDRGYKA
ncbi:hypothetical protein [Tropicimonas marinistellae]|uniref:hypothetical protein n=1 Tax=Tropicimonas marinistellae TaxID=1739787 RepID=UPI000833C736|nr:hypothetical protein [Tropicimonas marinistellae]